MDGLVLKLVEEREEGAKEGNGGYVLKNRKLSKST